MRKVPENRACPPLVWRVNPVKPNSKEFIRQDKQDKQEESSAFPEERQRGCHVKPKSIAPSK
jgi:hypothetical protein